VPPYRLSLRARHISPNPCFSLKNYYGCPCSTRHHSGKYKLFVSSKPLSRSSTPQPQWKNSPTDLNLRILAVPLLPVYRPKIKQNSGDNSGRKGRGGQKKKIGKANKKKKREKVKKEQKMSK